MKQNGEYQYDGFTTLNLYELILKTNMFYQIYSTYPLQHVALTVEALDLPPDQQPWFFGILTREEIQALRERTQIT